MFRSARFRRSASRLVPSRSLPRSSWAGGLPAISLPSRSEQGLRCREAAGSFNTAFRGIAGKNPEGVGGFGELSVKPSAADVAIISLEIKKLEIKIEKNEARLREAKREAEQVLYGGVLKLHKENLSKLYDEKKLLLRQRPTPGDGKQKSPVDTSRFKAPADVEIPMEKNAPPFVCAPGWLENIFAIVDERFNAGDTDTERVVPLSVARCSRGGKTRALREIALMFKEKYPGYATLFISFNSYFDPTPEEQRDPVQALRTRIAYFALNDELNPMEFSSFVRKTLVTELDILDWLGDRPCLLVVDELNALDVMMKGMEDMTDEERDMAKGFGQFLVDHFVKPKNRYLIFSSHVASTASNWEAKLRTRGLRGIEIGKLPISFDAKELHVAFKRLFKNFELVYHSFVPALLFLTEQDSRELYDLLSIQGKICEVAAERLSNDDIVKLFSSFFDGVVEKVPEPLHPFMDATAIEKIRWIPFHMIPILDNLEGNMFDLSDRTRTLMRSVVNEFKKGLCIQKDDNGMEWEILFVTAFLMRIGSNSVDEEIADGVNMLPLFWKSEEYSVSFNTLRPEFEHIENIKTVEELLEGMQPPTHIPHIAVYRPSHNQFKDYDMVVAVYDLNVYVKRLFGYQMKTGTANKHSLSANDEVFHTRYLICGHGSATSKSKDGWVVPGIGALQQFFGHSGKYWIPNIRDQALKEGNIWEAEENAR